jgi:hypothetical protein
VAEAAQEIAFPHPPDQRKLRPTKSFVQEGTVLINRFILKLPLPSSYLTSDCCFYGREMTTFVLVFVPMVETEILI